MVQKVIDEAGDLYLQIMKIPYTSVHFTPNFAKRKTILLTKNVGDKPDFKELGCNPEGRLWIQYNQYIYFFTVENKWDGQDPSNNTYTITRMCYNLETEEDPKIDKEFNPIGETNVEIEYMEDKPVPDGTKTYGARCVVFSTPMDAPTLNEKGEVVMQPIDLI